MVKKIYITGMAVFLVVILGLTACVPANAAAAANPANPYNVVPGGQGMNANQAGFSQSGPGTSSNQPPGAPGGGGFGYGRTSSPGRGTGGGGLALGPLSAAEIESLTRAILEEYRAQALYQSVLDTFGDVFPFNRIVLSEAQHASRLVNLAEKYGVAVPENGEVSGLPAFTTLQAACQAGVAAEIADAALYDEIMPSTSHADLLRVYTNLQAASLNNHLPAFQACQ